MRDVPHTRLIEAIRDISPEDLDRQLRAGRALYHSLEHIVGHRGQILLLRHLYRAGA